MNSTNEMHFLNTQSYAKKTQRSQRPQCNLQPYSVFNWALSRWKIVLYPINFRVFPVDTCASGESRLSQKIRNVCTKIGCGVCRCESVDREIVCGLNRANVFGFHYSCHVLSHGPDTCAQNKNVLHTCNRGRLEYIFYVVLIFVYTLYKNVGWVLLNYVH